MGSFSQEKRITSYKTSIDTFEPSSELSGMTKVKYIFHQKVTLGKVKTHIEMQSCNCQNIPQNCPTVHKYVKCSKGHPPEECPTL